MITLPHWGFRKLGVPYFGVVIIRILLFRVLHLGPVFFGNSHMNNRFDDCTRTYTQSVRQELSEKPEPKPQILEALKILSPNTETLNPRTIKS